MCIGRLAGWVLMLLGIYETLSRYNEKDSGVHLVSVLCVSSFAVLHVCSAYGTSEGISWQFHIWTTWTNRCKYSNTWCVSEATATRSFQSHFFHKFCVPLPPCRLRASATHAQLQCHHLPPFPATLALTTVKQKMMTNGTMKRKRQKRTGRTSSRQEWWVLFLNGGSALRRAPVKPAIPQMPAPPPFPVAPATLAALPTLSLKRRIS